MSYKPLDYPEGSILVDVKYYRKPECFEVIYWNPLTHQIELKYEEPIIDIWFLKSEYRTNQYQISQAEIDKSYPVYCKPSQVAQAIATNVGGEYQELYDTYSGQFNQRDLKSYMCKCPWVFKADFEESVYFRLRWMKQFGEECDVSKVTYGFLDIEVDVIDKTVNPKDHQDVSQPINAVTVILPHVNICAVMILGPRPKNKIHSRYHDLLETQKKEWEWLQTHQEEFKRMIVEEDEDNRVYLKGYDIRLHLFDFEQEIYLIKTVFDYINKYRPMFCMSWNATFDDNYLMNRISYLGYDPKQIIIPKKFKTKLLYFKDDNSKNFAIKTNRDWWFTSTYTTYLCQMRLYAAIRKSQSERRSYSLSAIGKAEAGIDKLTQTKSGTFRQFAYTDFLKFILYNVRDVVVQLAIEMKCNDCQSLVGRSYMYATSYSKCFQETHIVRNIREYIFEQDGYIQACRLEIDPTMDTAFKGAYVADPAKNAPTGMILNGKKINNVIYGSLDADAESYYPSEKMGNNMDPMSLLYKCKIDNDVFKYGKCINHSLNQEYIWYDSHNPPRAHDEDMTGPIINSFKNENEMSVLHNWFNLPSVSDYFAYIDSML